MKTSLTFLCALGAILSLTAPVASAQTATGASLGSGTTVPVFSLEELQRQEIARQWQVRLERSENFRQAWLQEKAFVKAMHVNDKQYRTRQAQRREECRTEMRKASKLSQLSVSLECYRDDLADNLERLEKQREYVERVPGVSDDVRWLTLTRVDLLGDALTVIINAIDSDVYQSVEELEEAKQNLLISYRQPLWLMETRLRADKMMTWTASLLTRIGALGQTELDAATAKQLYDGVACLGEGESLLKEVLSSQELGAASTKLAAAQAHLTDCIEILRGEGTLLTEAASEEVVEASEPGRVPQRQELNSRRVQRRLSRQHENYYLTRVPGARSGTHGAASEQKPFDTRLLLRDEGETAATTCNGAPISRRLQRCIGDTCNIANH